jgi:hypothetical protein
MRCIIDNREVEELIHIVEIVQMRCIVDNREVGELIHIPNLFMIYNKEYFFSNPETTYVPL